MPIQVNDINVIDDDRNIIASGIATVGSGSSATTINGETGVVNVGTGITMNGISGNISIAGTINAGGLNFPGLISNIFPSNGATGVAVNTNIILSFYFTPPTRGTGTIELRSGSTSGTVIESFDATSSDRISIVGNDWILDPTSNLGFTTSIHIIIPSTAIQNYVGLNTTGADSHSFTTRDITTGDAYEGGFLICKASPIRWVVSTCTSEVSRTWYCRNDANTRAQQVSGCSGWFVPTITQLQNPGYVCRTYWDYCSATQYWSSSECAPAPSFACLVNFTNGNTINYQKDTIRCIRSFRCVTY